LTRATETRRRRRRLVVGVAATRIVGVAGDAFVAPYASASGSNAWAMVAAAMRASDGGGRRRRRSRDERIRRERRWMAWVDG
jgi:uncharacterized protein YfaP (DUF2135 family)|tara:strand:+ start:457 stop:702 length:246 start_codon:yes stop_codon:yes gene_type:complete